MDNQLLFFINEASQIGSARREAIRLARGLGFNETETEKVAIVVTELASNLVKHTSGGQLLVQAIENVTTGVEIISLDRSGGMVNVVECLRDGYSTAGSPGNGLGSIQRLSAEFELYSQPGIGTTLISRLWSSPTKHVNAPSQIAVGNICIPIKGEDICGDSWAIKKHSTGCNLLVVDGLGHGFEAAKAAREAVRVFADQPITSPTETLEVIHRALRGTRGAAVAVAEINFGDVVKYAGIGNIAGVIISDKSQKHLVSHNGIAGYEARKIQEFTYPFEKDALLVMHSDGLQSRWNLETYSGLLIRHPSLIASTLYRDFARGTDDVTVIAVKEKA